MCGGLRGEIWGRRVDQSTALLLASFSAFVGVVLSLGLSGPTRSEARGAGRGGAGRAGRGEARLAAAPTDSWGAGDCAGPCFSSRSRRGASEGPIPRPRPALPSRAAPRARRARCDDALRCFPVHPAAREAPGLLSAEAGAPGGFAAAPRGTRLTAWLAMGCPLPTATRSTPTTPYRMARSSTRQTCGPSITR